MRHQSDIFTFNTDGSLTLAAQDLWGPYLTALAEGKPPPKPPPDSERHAEPILIFVFFISTQIVSTRQKLSLTTGAAYFARQTLAITIQIFDECFGQASRASEDQQSLWTGPRGG